MLIFLAIGEMLRYWCLVAFWQVIGSLHSVQDALFQITSRLRQTIFPVKPYLPGASGSPYLPPYSEMPPPMFRSRHDPGSPGHYPSPGMLPRGVDRVPFPPQSLDPHPFLHGMDHVGPTYFDRIPYPYGSERPGHGPSYDGQPSPREWAYQVVNYSCNYKGLWIIIFLRYYLFLLAFQAGSSGNPREVAEIGGSFAFSSGPLGRWCSLHSIGHCVVISTQVTLYFQVSRLCWQWITRCIGVELQSVAFSASQV